ncbi:MAG TPA: aminotransferase class I/II-fold pyridoxal phosphate-dependent enzyme, partial [Burkholderiaceae bacterium]|nr:aminotransferase class I/II-fold pyridoxal phosphate-dependent enzyme [Burkholderiaceae bacterium]
MSVQVPFVRPYFSPRARANVESLLREPQLVGDGHWGKHCERQLEALTGCRRALLTPSATAALELSIMVLGLGPGDEVILPSFTFPSCANAVALRGATPVFCDVDPQTLCATLATIEPCRTERTRAVMVVHYGGLVADMPPLADWCRRHGLALIEDAAQAIGAALHGRMAGTFGDLGVLSFHGTKNVGCGEGGALLLNDERWLHRCEILREKGTDRSRFLRGEIDKYSWQDLGSSWIIGELSAAYLAGQLDDLELINDARRTHWRHYAAALRPLADRGMLQLPPWPDGVQHNGHCFYVLLPDAERQQRVQAA